MRIIPSDICTALDDINVIGSKVIDHRGFMDALHAAVASHDFKTDRVPGQGFVLVPTGIQFVSSGVGRPTQDPEDYSLKLYRGRVSAFLKREHAAAVESLACVVYTKAAYLQDPDVTTDEAARIAVESIAWPVTHVLVAVLASSGPKSQLSPYRFTHNLAGGNHEALAWSADEIRAKAREILDYDSEWVTVADH